MVQESPVQRGIISVQRGESSIFATFGGHLGFSWRILTHRVVQESPVQRGIISIFANFGGHLGFLRKMKKCQYLENRKR